ncbi:hypothetical protein EGD00_07740 [Pectobacterium carotovorum subsp. carotovorum]|nr:hypothetical protein EGD00_07740 [Pectobacterium carotovorum subsp. carotovorum]
MQGRLIFCSDSILRFRSDYDETTTLPLLSIQNAIGKEPADPYFLLRFFRHEVIIEKGTTLAHIFFAIEPWKDLLTAYLDRNVGAYIDEIRKPSKPTTWNLDWIGIDRRTGIYRSYEHQEKMEGEELTAYFNRERIPTKEFNIESSCDASGFAKGDNERWSISGDIHEIKNLPVVLYRKQALSAHLDKKKSLFKKDIQGVHDDGNGSFIIGETSLSFYEVMEALFISGLFYDTPQYARESLDEIKGLSESLHDNLNKDGVDNVDNENVLNISEEEPVKAETDDEEDKPMKVEIADGAFDSVIDHMRYESEQWKHLKEQCKDDNVLLVRIGSIEPAEPPELRLFGKIIEGSSNNYYGE